ncbi:peptidase M23-like protein [Geothermobacter ehrlichii]|uniref:Peptidase M23-like protein n=1 Tax=Geothermobacter ehrlichii TaxID=213224 RepID=A0A5D3WJS9_9BACT|nr:M23 family metallopeptidase [Geothermobacter ehrlichii]TYO99225.1 peptidase M23-like protein [Geothermobacter ehrlichii]
MRTSSVILLLVVLIGLVAGGIYYFRDTGGPVASLTPDGGPVSVRRPLLLVVDDADSGLKRVRVSLRQNDRELVLLERDFAPGTRHLQQKLSLKGLKLKNAPLQIRVEATDTAIYHFGQGNTSVQEFSLLFDSRPPTISVVSRSHNLNQGGSGLIVYTLSEEVERTGVEVGELFFPAFRQQDGRYLCLFSAPWNQDPKNLTFRVVAVDRAGNERRSGFYHHLNRKPRNRTRINVSDRFLETKMPDFQDQFPDTDDLVALFLKVNRELRRANRDRLKEIAAETAPSPLWQGAFLRPRGSNREPFATERTYLYRGRKIDSQVHLGVDIASVARGPVVAANSGTVVLAEEFGIYGQCVIIDHGLGLMSLYGHMSNIEVNVGDEVTKGQEIGRTGATGLAGGDHLHFGLLVDGLPVNPVEWWDRNWVKNNISRKLAGS